MKDFKAEFHTVSEIIILKRVIKWFVKWSSGGSVKPFNQQKCMSFTQEESWFKTER